MKRLSAGKIIFVLVWMCILASLPTTGWAVPSWDTVLLDSGGWLNGQVVDPAQYRIQVQPGELLNGWINIRAYNYHGPGAVVPVAATFTWGEREKQPWLVTGHITPGWHNLTVNITGQNEHAPTTPGIYHIMMSNAGEFTAEQIMSRTNWAYEREHGHVVWYDDNDIGWDWTTAEFQQSRDNGQVTHSYLFRSGYRDYTNGANWVEVRVVPEPVLIEAPVDIDPDVLNLKSRGKWITCYIWLPEPYDVADVDPDTILLNGQIGPAWSWIDEAEQMLMAKFPRSQVQQMLEPGKVELTVSGELIDGTKFEGSDTIKVIDKGGKK